MKKWIALAASLAVITGAGFFAYHQIREDNEILNQSEIVGSVDSSQNFETEQEKDNPLNGEQSGNMLAHNVTKDPLEMQEQSNDRNEPGREVGEDGDTLYIQETAEILTTVYGEVGNEGDRIAINMPGGCLEGEDAKAMIKEVAMGKAGAES